VVAIAAVAGMPPFALFASEFLLLTETAARFWWLALPLGLGLFIAVTAKVNVMQQLCLGDATPDAAPGPAGAVPGRLAFGTTLGPIWVHLVLALVLGAALPAGGAALLAQAAEMLR
jgi:hydrogenase-4 component F